MSIKKGRREQIIENNGFNCFNILTRIYKNNKIPHYSGLVGIYEGTYPAKS